MVAQLTAYMHIGLLLWLRCAPLFLLTPYLVAGVVPGFWGGLLSGGMAVAMTPLMLRGCLAQTACVAALGHTPSWGSGSYELLLGSVTAVGIAAPLVAFRTLGAIAQGLGGPTVARAAAQQSPLGRTAGFIALVAAAVAGALGGFAQLLLQHPPVVGAAPPAHLALRQLLLPLCYQLVRAFLTGVSLCAPLLLASTIAAVLLGLLARVSGARFLPVGPAVMPWLGVALVTLCVANWLDALPVVVRSFAQSTLRLLRGLP